MIQDEIRAFLASIQSAFYAGDLHALLGHFQFPLVVYTAAGVAVLRDGDQFEAMAQDYLSALKALSITHGRQSILTRDPMINGRQRITVRNVDLNALDEPVTGSTVRYFLLRTSDAYMVEMLEYLEMPLPVPDVEKILH